MSLVKLPETVGFGNARAVRAAPSAAMVSARPRAIRAPRDSAAATASARDTGCCAASTAGNHSAASGQARRMAEKLAVEPYGNLTRPAENRSLREYRWSWTTRKCARHGGRQSTARLADQGPRLRRGRG